MTIRTKICLIAVSGGVTVGAASWERMSFTRARIVADAQTSAEELAHDIAQDLERVEADADERDLEQKLLGYLKRHSRIVALDLYFSREAYTPSSGTAAPRGTVPRSRASRPTTGGRSGLRSRRPPARRRSVRSRSPSTSRGPGKLPW